MRPLRQVLVSTAAACLACASMAPTAGCGQPAASNRPRSARAPAPPPVQSLGRWEHADAARGFRSVARVRSQHIGNGSTEAEILANDVAAAYPELGPTRRLPAGSVLLEQLRPAGNGAVSAWFAMVRSPADAGAPTAGPGRWQFLVVRPDGELLARDPPACARCHAEAPLDGVFGPPHEQRAPR